jgi:hypothetical protein
MNVGEIQKLFGSPISQYPKPSAGFKWTKYHTFFAIGVGLFTVYGIFAAQRDMRKWWLKKTAEQKKEENSK